MVIAVVIADKNNIMADENLNNNLNFLKKIKPELKYFSDIVKNGDVLIGEISFWEAIIELDGLKNFKNKKVYVISNKTFDQLQNINKEIKLPNNIEITSNIENTIEKYQKDSKDIFIWGGVRTINNFSPLAQQIIIIRITNTRAKGLKFNQAILNNFILKNTKHYHSFQVETYLKFKS